MATQVHQEIDLQKAQAFAHRVVGETTSIMIGTLHLVGDRLGLFDLLAERGPSTSQEFASSAGINERYAREWLSAMACHGYLLYDDLTERFTLPPEHALVLSSRESPFYLGSLIRLQPDFWANADLLTEAFRCGGGVSQEYFGREWLGGLERFTRPAFLNNLARDWIPALPEIERRLHAGGSAADVGCGNGQALIELAHAYPRSWLVGYDAHAPAIDVAREHARRAGVADRVRFEVRDVAAGLPEPFDLITCFDVVHDLPRLLEVLRAIRAALSTGGSLFVQEFNLSSDLQENIRHPLKLGAFGYAASLNYCLTTALAAGGVGTGTCQGERTFRSLAGEAGFQSVRRLDFPTNPFSVFFEARP